MSKTALKEKTSKQKKKEIKDMEGDPIKTDNNWGPNSNALYVSINRKKENQDVVLFQKTGDIKILERIYHRRVPNLQILANKYKYLTSDSEDMFEELTFHFIKTVHGYDPKRGSFNTYFYSSMLYCTRNLRNNKKAKKRRPKGSDPDSIANFTLSLDYNYNTKDGSDSTLKDVIANDLASEDSTMDRLCLEETIDLLANENVNVKSFLKKISDGNSVSALLKECKTKEGKIKISKVQGARLDTKRRCNRIVTNLIKNKTNIDEDFKLVNYHVVDLNKLHYKIEMKKTAEADFLMKTIRKLKKDREHLLQKIKGR